MMTSIKVVARRFFPSSALALVLTAAAALPPTADGQGGKAREEVRKPAAPSKKAEAPRPPAPLRRVRPPAAVPGGVVEEVEQVIPGSKVVIALIYLGGGAFKMGSPKSETGRSPDEEPGPRDVTVPGFAIGKFEVTQAQWRAVMRGNPSRIKGDARPVENVSWERAAEFCRRLSRMTGREYRLPTEAEWEYAARGGTGTPFAFGASLSTARANCGNTRPYSAPTRVGAFQPNAFGLYDMHGNVWEWCEDNYHDNYHGAPSDGSAWLAGGSPERIVRGGSSDSPARSCRSAYRDKEDPKSRRNNLGFRVVTTSRP